MFCSLFSRAQQTASSNLGAGVVPTLVNFSGTLADAHAKPLTGTVGVTFNLYKDQQGGSPLWMETQNVEADNAGHYTVALGATKSQGLPTNLFASGEARWLGVQVQGQVEQPRIMLLAVPYALKAGDAQTIGGLPASSFVLAAPTNSGTSSSGSNTSSNSNPPALGGSGTTDYLPIWTNSTTLGSSVLFQPGTGVKAKVGIGTKKPASALDVKGGGTIRGLFSLPAAGMATASAGFNSQPMDLVTSAFNSGTSTAVPQTFQWKAEPVGNNTSTTSGSLNLLFGQGINKPSETGLNIASDGQITFATGQTFPGTGTITGVNTTSGSGLTGGGTSGTLNLALTNTCAAKQVLQWNGSAWACTAMGTVTSVASGFGLTGGPITGSGTLSIDTTVVPLLSASNTFTSGQGIVTSGNIDALDAYATGVGRAGVVGVATATSGTSSGVVGGSASLNGYGVSGSNSGGGTGVHGQAPATAGYPVVSVGVFGQNGAESGVGTGLPCVPFNFCESEAGVWGDGGAGSPLNGSAAAGIVGTANDGVAGLFVNNSPSDYYTMSISAENSATWPFAAYATLDSCVIDASAQFSCNGSLNAVVPIDGGQDEVALSAIESPNNWFEDAGSSELVNGAAVVLIDSEFTQTANTAREYQVLLTPYGDCKGLYVSNRTANSFEVHELGGGASSLSFGYRIMALRKDYESVRFADHTHDLDRMDQIRKRARAAEHKGPLSHMPVNNTMLIHPAAQTTAAK
jgi:hypothetical protein